MKPKYVTYHGGPRMFVIIANRMQCGSWKVEVSPCDYRGSAVSDPVAQDIFPSWWEAFKFRRQMYKEYDKYVNHN